MNIIDEQILENQRQLLRSWRIPIRQIGYDIGRKGLKDEGEKGPRQEFKEFSDFCLMRTISSCVIHTLLP